MASFAFLLDASWDNLMPVIETKELTKIFRVPQKDPGVKGAVKALFRPHHKEVLAVDKINFSVNRGEGDYV